MALSVSLKEDPKPSMPFSMIEGMMGMYPIIAVMGWMMVGIAVILAALFISPAFETLFEVSKAVREGDSRIYIEARTSIHQTEAWLPQFKFLGLGFGLMAIAMALGTIAKRLRRMGKVISAHIEPELRPQMPPIPRAVRIMQLSVMMGVMILIITLIIGIVLATGVVPDYWSAGGVGSTLNSASEGSDLLAQGGIAKSFHFWLSGLRMLGMAFLFLGITIALFVIIKTLKLQNNLLTEYVAKVS